MEMEVYFDYYCPYCYRAYLEFKDVIVKYPEVEIIWKPCESHPRPERCHPHSDLAIQGMYYVQDQGGDLMQYHDRMYGAMFEKRIDLENVDLLAGCIQDMDIDTEAYKGALNNGTYRKHLEANNRKAWEEQGFYAVPSYIAGGKRLLSKDGRAVSKEELEQFLSALQQKCKGDTV